MIRPDDILAARQQRNITQLRAAIEVGVSYQAYRLWETGGTRPSPENEVKLRKVLKMGGGGHVDARPRNSK